MYERPTLNRVGKAQDVIMGCIATGTDVDTLYLGNEEGYADDGEYSDDVIPTI